MDYGSTSIEAVHAVILRDAAAFANRSAMVDDRLPDLFSGEIFTPIPSEANPLGLSLTLARGMEYLPADAYPVLREIAKEAVRKAILKNQREFVGLILGEARAGRNYFDQLAASGEQLRIL